MFFIINFSFHSRPLPHKEQRIAVMVDKQFIQHILLLSIRATLEYPPHLAVQKSRFSYMARPAIRMAYRLAHSEPMLDITVQEL